VHILGLSYRGGVVLEEWMLTSLLPGIRNLRAPLAAGYLWLLALGLLLEPHIPDRANATGLIASLYRLSGALRPAGLLAVATFAAYLIGSLSMALLTTPLRALAPARIEPERAGTWNTLPRVSLTTLWQTTRDARVRLEDILVLSDTNLGTELRRWIDPRERSGGATTWERLRDRISRLLGILRFRRRGATPSGPESTATSTTPPPTAAEQEEVLFRALVDDLGVVTTTRLLGRDPELYSAIDRSRAEAEFRFAIIPALFTTGVALGGRAGGGGTVVALATLAALAFALGLFWDAIRHQRDAYALLVDALADGRVTLPTLDRLQARAQERASRSKADAVRKAAILVATAIAKAIKVVEEISKPGREIPEAEVLRARTAVRDARKQFAAVEPTLPAVIADQGTRSLDTLEQVVRMWTGGWLNKRPLFKRRDVDKLITDATQHLEAYRNAVWEELHSLREQLPPGPKGDLDADSKSDRPVANEERQQQG
jgi:hypothetical protein